MRRSEETHQTKESHVHSQQPRSGTIAATRMTVAAAASRTGRALLAAPPPPPSCSHVARRGASLCGVAKSSPSFGFGSRRRRIADWDDVATFDISRCK